MAANTKKPTLRFQKAYGVSISDTRASKFNTKCSLFVTISPTLGDVHNVVITIFPLALIMHVTMFVQP